MRSFDVGMANFTQLTFVGSPDAIAAAAVSDAIAPTRVDSTFPPYARVMVSLVGAVSSSDVSVSIGVKDGAGVVGWSPVQTAEVRALPDGTKVVSMFTFPTLRAAAIVAVLESAIAGGTVKLYIAFQDEN
jgi:hypothetical protein